MKQMEHRLDTPQGTSLYVRGTVPDTPWAVLQIAHGMAEHIQRYDAFAQAMAEAGIAVYGNDHAGHGRTTDAARYGYLYATEGWRSLVEDMHALRIWEGERHPGLPVFLLGHSMGSFLARSYARAHGDTLSGLILSGTAGPNPALGLGKLLARMEMRRLSPHRPCKLVDALAFSGNNRPFKPARTAFDWLCSDPAVVDAYIADPACGFPFTATGYRDLFDGLTEISAPDWADKLRRDVPILLFSGERDPVGGMGKGVRWVEESVRKAGVRDVTCVLYPQGRHEMLNEVNRLEVYTLVLDWVRRVAQPRA